MLGYPSEIWLKPGQSVVQNDFSADPATWSFSSSRNSRAGGGDRRKRGHRGRNSAHFRADDNRIAAPKGTSRTRLDAAGLEAGRSLETEALIVRSEIGGADQYTARPRSNRLRLVKCSPVMRWRRRRPRWRRSRRLSAGATAKRSARQDLNETDRVMGHRTRFHFVRSSIKRSQNLSDGACRGPFRFDMSNSMLRRFIVSQRSLMRPGRHDSAPIRVWCRVVSAWRARTAPDVI